MRRPARFATLLLLAAFLAPVGVGSSSPSDAAHDAPAAANPAAAAGPASAAVTASTEAPPGDCCSAHTGCAAASCASAGCSVSPAPSRDGLFPGPDPCAASIAALDLSAPTGPVTDLSGPPPRV